ncbi:MAG: nitrilase family protein [Bacteroidales bacterium]|nr:nitrilase family protein [Bacteroidales bacterium]
MENIRVSTAQFENRSGDKAYNLSIIDSLAQEAANAGSHIVAFHECSITGYTFARNLTKKQMLKLAEFIPGGESTARLVEIAAKHNIAIIAGLFEKDGENRIYKASVCVDKNGLVARHRKLHPFINAHVTPGNEYTIFDLFGWKCGMLICYDNNIIENVRATVLLGARIIFMPHVTMGTPSPRPGAGFFDMELWKNREMDPVPVRAEFDGPKGREWIMKWLPSRAFDNGVYVVFSNPIGMDGDQLKNGCSMVLDPFGDIIGECRSLGNEIASAEVTPGKLILAGGYRYSRARRPDLYRDIVGRKHKAVQKVAWLDD